jgi:hypothetical protein
VLTSSTYFTFCNYHATQLIHDQDVQVGRVSAKSLLEELQNGFSGLRGVFQRHSNVAQHRHYVCADQSRFTGNQIQILNYLVLCINETLVSNLIKFTANLSDFSAVKSLLETEATRALTQLMSTAVHACSAMQRFSMAVSRSCS